MILATVRREKRMPHKRGMRNVQGMLDKAILNLLEKRLRKNCALKEPMLSIRRG